MIFQAQFKNGSGTYTYLIASTTSREAIVIDPVAEAGETLAELLENLDLELVYALETGALSLEDSSAEALRRRFGCPVVGPCDGQRSVHASPVGHGDELLLGDFSVQVIGRPGGRNVSVAYRIGDRVFVGERSPRHEPALRALPLDTWICRTRDARGTGQSLLALEMGASRRARARWQDGDGKRFQNHPATDGRESYTSMPSAPGSS